MSGTGKGGEDHGSEVRIRDRSLMMVFLLEECNFSCVHCVRDEEPMAPDYRLTLDQLGRCLDDCRRLKSVRWVHFSGGEPTLWHEGELGLLDLLLEISRAGFEPGFTTNGSNFLDPVRCSDLLRGYSSAANMPLRLYLSIDTFHRNFDVGEGRAQALDNVMECLGAMPAGEAALVGVNVLTVVSKDASSTLPEEMVQRYEDLGVRFTFTPLLPKGRGRSLGHLCPDLGSDRPEDLGAYLRFRSSGPPRRPDEVANVVLIGEDYYFPDPWRRVARLGRLPRDILGAYSTEV